MNPSEPVLQSLFEKLENYGNTTVKLLKLNAIAKSADVASSLTSSFTLIIIAAFFVLLSSIGLSLWLGNVLGENYYGFFAVAGLFALIGIILRANIQKWVRLPFKNSFIIQLMNHEDGSDN